MVPIWISSNITKIYNTQSFLNFNSKKIQHQELYHPYDRDKTLLSVEEPRKTFKANNLDMCTSPKVTKKNKYLQLQKWFKQLKICSEKVFCFFNFLFLICLILQKVNNMEFEQYKFRPIGKIFITSIIIKKSLNFNHFVSH